MYIYIIYIYIYIYVYIHNMYIYVYIYIYCCIYLFIVSVFFKLVHLLILLISRSQLAVSYMAIDIPVSACWYSNVASTDVLGFSTLITWNCSTTRPSGGWGCK